MSYHQTSVAMRQARSMRRNSNTVRYASLKTGMGPISETLLLGLIVAIIGLIYLTQVTKTSAYGYQVDNLNNAKELLIQENQSLSVESARLQALERIRTSEVASQLVEPTRVDFIR